MAAIVKLAPHELVVVAETGVPPAVKEIIDVNLDEFPELAHDHPHYERRRSERMKFIKENEQNAERRARITLKAWTTLFESLRSCCVLKAKLLADDLYEVCALSVVGIPVGYFDGPRAWNILIDLIEGDDERSEYDKKFYDTALDWQKQNRLSNGASAQDFQQRAYAFIHFIMPNLAQKYEPHDAA